MQFTKVTAAVILAYVSSSLAAPMYGQGGILARCTNTCATDACTQVCVDKRTIEIQERDCASTCAGDVACTQSCSSAGTKRQDQDPVAIVQGVIGVIPRQDPVEKGEAFVNGVLGVVPRQDPVEKAEAFVNGVLGVVPRQDPVEKAEAFVNGVLGVVPRQDPITKAQELVQGVVAVIPRKL